jgi:hypothetical protein
MAGAVDLPRRLYDMAAVVYAHSWRYSHVFWSAWLVFFLSLFFECGYVVAQKVDDAGLARCPGRPLEQGKR